MWPEEANRIVFIFFLSRSSFLSEALKRNAEIQDETAIGPILTFDGPVAGALEQRAGTAGLRHGKRHSGRGDGVDERRFPRICTQETAREN